MCDHSVYIILCYITSLKILFFEVCQTILTRFVHSVSYGPYVSDLMTFLGDSCAPRKQQFILHGYTVHQTMLKPFTTN